MGGSPPPAPPPAQAQTVSQTAEFPEELKPYITDILERAKTRAEARDEAGFQLFPGPRLADFTAEQKAAQQGIVNLVGAGLSSDPTLASAKTYMAPALGGTLASMQSFTPEAAQQYMSPYMQSVVDIQKREADRQGARQFQDIAARGAATGGFGGSRQAILEAEQFRNQAQLMDDIQRKGSQTAFEQAAAQFEREKNRQRTGGQQLAGLAELAPRLATAELGALSGVGAQKQQQDQRATDISYQQFLEEQQFPERVLQEYSSIIRGFPLTPNVFTATQTATPPPNLMTQVAGLVGAGASGLRAFGKKGGGISSIPLKKVPKENKGLQALKKEAPEAVAKMGFYQTGGDVGQGMDEIDMQTALYTPYINPGAATTRVSIPSLEGLQSDRRAVRERIKALLDAQEEKRKARKESAKQDKALALMQGFLQMAQAGGEGKGLVEGLTQGAQATVPQLQKVREAERSIDDELDAEALKLATLQGDISGQEFAENLALFKEISAQKIANAKLAAAAGADLFKFDKAMNDTVRSVLKQELDNLDPQLQSRILEAQRQAIASTPSVGERDALANYKAQLMAIAKSISASTGNVGGDSSNDETTAGTALGM